MIEPALREHPGDGQILVMAIQRAPSRFAIAGWPPEPLGEEQLLPLPLAREIPAKERSEHAVALETVVEGVHQAVDCGLATNAVEYSAVLERTKAWCGTEHPAMGQARVNAAGHRGP